MASLNNGKVRQFLAGNIPLLIGTLAFKIENVNTQRNYIGLNTGESELIWV
jgi:hypothetical protein